MKLEYLERCRIEAACEDSVAYVVVEYQMVVTHMMGCFIKRTKSGLVYRLDDGRDVHWVTSALFQIVDNGKLIQRSDVLENRL
ncbi:MAG: hypothetical protein Q8M31_01815 [Beijerinckiaceae bacterium]|nr:hypothetical protein [Beijerinckiaceae bacterium]